MTGHNPLIFLGRPAAQMSLLSGNAHDAMFERGRPLLVPSLEEKEGQGTLNAGERSLLEEFRSRDKERKQTSELVDLMESYYTQVEEKFRELGLYEQVIKHFKRVPVAPVFELPQGEYGEDQPHESKLLGIPDLRGDFLITHSRLIRESGDLRESDVPDWAKRNLDEVLADLWPRNPSGGYMKFAAQVAMSRPHWDMLLCAGAEKAGDDRELVSTPLGTHPLSLRSDYAYIFHSSVTDFTVRMTACADFSAPGRRDDVIPWDEYVAAVKRVIPEEAYTNDDLGCVSAPLGEPVAGLQVDLGNMFFWGQYSDPTSGAKQFSKVLKKMEKGGFDDWELRHLSLGGIGEGQKGVAVGGRPSSQQEERRPWDPASYGGPTRMVPFFSYWEECDVTHQIYLSGARMESSAYWGFDDHSCT